MFVSLPCSSVHCLLILSSHLFQDMGVCAGAKKKDELVFDIITDNKWVFFFKKKKFWW